MVGPWKIFCSVTLKSRSRSLIIKLVQDLHIMHMLCKFGDPALNLWKVIASTVLHFFCSVTMESRSRSLISKLIQELHGMRMWYTFGGPALTPRKVIVSTVFSTFFLCDLGK